MSADGSSGPQPTAHKFESGCTLSRREAMQTSALALAAMAGAGAGTGTVAADDGDHGIVSGLTESVSDAMVEGMTGGTPVIDLAVFVGAIVISELDDSINRDPSADRQILHQLVHNEIEWMNSHFVNFGNYMNDTRPIASLEARHGMASVWEDGGGSSEGHDYALQRIRQYYELPEFNHLHAGNKALLQLMYIHKSGQDTDDEYPVTGSAYIDGVEEDNVDFRFTDDAETEEVELELHDGTTVDEDAFEHIDHTEGAEGVFTTPVFEFVDYDDGEVLHSQPITQDVLDSYDPDGHPLHGNGSVTFTDDDETEYVTDLQLVVENVGDADEDPSLGSQRAFDGLEWLDLLEEVEELSDDVVSWYDQSFVEDIYGELDAGNITPEQVRSPEGMARYLSGTDDPEDSRFQVSWMQQFGFERADMSIVSGMEVEWTGATDTEALADPDLDDRHVRPSDRVDDLRYEGVLFGRETPEGFESGRSYSLDPQLFIASETDGDLESFSAFDGSHNWTYQDAMDAEIRGIARHPDKDRLFLVDTDDAIRAVDYRDEETVWSASTTATQPDTHLSTENEIFFVGSPTARAFDSEDGTELWERDEDYAGYFAMPDDESELFLSYYETLESVDPETGETNWTYDLPARVEDLDCDSDGSIVAVSVEDNTEDDGYIHAVDTDDQSEMWEFDFEGEDYATTVSFSPDDESLVSGTFEEQVMSIDSSDGSELWAHSHDGRPYESAFSPDGSLVYLSGLNVPVTALDSDGGTFEFEMEAGSSYYGLEIPQPDVDGMAARSMMFDEENGEQVDLWDGVVTINEMWDADGATIEHVNDETIEDIESLEETPDDIETIIDEMDQFDDESDIQYTRHVLEILEFYDAEDKEDDVTTDEPDYDSPDYDSFDSSEFAEEMAALEEKIEQLESDEDGDGDGDDDEDGWGLPSFGGGFDGGAFAGLAIIAGVVLVVVSAVTDLLPWT